MSSISEGGLCAQAVSYHIGSKALLREVSVAIRPGLVTAVLGPNGAGKSTLLRLLSGDMPPSAGAVTLDDRALTEWGDPELALRRAIMPQSAMLTFPFTAFQVAALGRTPHITRIGTDRDHTITEAALSRAGADHLSDRIYPTLSGGERQRVDFARALTQIWTPQASGSRYLLLDEPTSSLDLARQHELLGRVRDLAREGVGVLVVLHDLNLAGEYADEVLVLREGEVVGSGPPAHAFTPERIEQAYSLRTIVTTHPRTGRPLVIADPSGAPAGPASILPSSGVHHAAVDL